ASVQKRAWANGRSRLTVYAATLSPRAWSSSANRLVCLLQTGVSSEGTTLKSRAFPVVSASETRARPAPTRVKSGALSTVFNLGPTRVTGLPLKVTSPFRASAMAASPGASEREHLRGPDELIRVAPAGGRW